MCRTVRIVPTRCIRPERSVGSHRPGTTPVALSAARGSAVRHAAALQSRRSRSGIARPLKHEGMSRPENVVPKAEGETITPKKTFEDYEPGFINIDVKYRRHDRQEQCRFSAPFEAGLAHQDQQDADPTAARKYRSFRHQREKTIARFNGRINELLQQPGFDSRADLQATLMNYLKLYNHHVPQRALDAKTSILALKEWQQKRPELFVNAFKRDSTSGPQLSVENGDGLALPCWRKRKWLMQHERHIATLQSSSAIFRGIGSINDVTAIKNVLPQPDLKACTVVSASFGLNGWIRRAGRGGPSLACK